MSNERTNIGEAYLNSAKRKAFRLKIGVGLSLLDVLLRPYTKFQTFLSRHSAIWGLTKTLRPCLLVS